MCPGCQEHPASLPEPARRRPCAVCSMVRCRCCVACKARARTQSSALAPLSTNSGHRPDTPRSPAPQGEVPAGSVASETADVDAPRLPQYRITRAQLEFRASDWLASRAEPYLNLAVGEELLYWPHRESHGWAWGVRAADGEPGWFPMGFCEE